MSLEIITDAKGNDMVFIVNDDGTTQSMLKSTYDTLASELSNPSTPQAGE